jgi:hypothetical protein
MDGQFAPQLFRDQYRASPQPLDLALLLKE